MEEEEHRSVTSAGRTAAECERTLPEGSIWGHTWDTWTGRCRVSGRLLGQTSYRAFPIQKSERFIGLNFGIQ